MWRGAEVGIAWFTGYVIEYSLSVDNVFVFALVFAAFAVPRELQHRVLFWGVAGCARDALRAHPRGRVAHRAVPLDHLRVRGVPGVHGRPDAACQSDDHEPHPENNPLVRFAKRHLRVVSEFHGQRFFIPTAVGRAATPLLLALIAVETTDLIFAVDSIPAIFAVTTDPFIVFTSNAFAILGLRSLYFLLAHAADRFRYLKLGLAAGAHLRGRQDAVTDILHLDPMPSLVVILGILGAAMAASLLADRRDARNASVG